MFNKTIKAAGIATLAIALAGCGSNESGSQAASEDVSGQGAGVSENSEAVVSVADPVAESDLAAGLAVMQPRLLSTSGGLGEVLALPEHRFFMHPDLGQPSVATFDVSGLSSITLSPRMKDLSADAACVANPEAGVVSFSWNAGPNATGKQEINRNSNELIELKLDGAEKLELQVGDGNASVECDWFTIGFVGAV